MKKVLRTLTFVLAVAIMVSSVSFAASAAEFEDYYPEAVYLAGDADGDGEITIKDATSVQKYLAKLITLSEWNLYLADVNASGDITISDATLIQKYLAYIIDVFPADESEFENIECVVDGDAVTVELSGYEGAYVSFEIEEEGFYKVEASTAEGLPVMFDINDAGYDRVWSSETDEETSFVYTQFAQDTYYAYVYGVAEETVTLSFSVSSGDGNAPFDKGGAQELKSGDAIHIESGKCSYLYKVDLTAARDALDTVCIYTEGEAPAVRIRAYDENYAFLGEAMDWEDGINLILGIYDNLVDDWAYVVADVYEDSSDFTLYCTTMSELYQDNAQLLELDTDYDMEVVEFTEEFEEELVTVYVAAEDYIFRPAQSGYYKLSLTGTSAFDAVGSAYNCNATEDEMLVFYRTSEDDAVADVQYYNAGGEYFMSVVVMADSYMDVTLTLTVSDEDEYNALKQDEFEPWEPATYDEIEYEEIKLGERVEVNLAESELKGFFFTAEEDCEVVLYSENSVDSYVDIYDADMEFLFCGDDITILGISDFAVLGTLEAGETCYFELGTYEASDSFSFCLTANADYVPLD